MKRKQKKIIFAYLLVLVAYSIITILFIVSTRTPIKYAIRIEDVSKYSEVILIREVWHTGTGWEQVGDNSGYFDIALIEDVHLTGNIPPTTAIGGDHVNIFLCQIRLSGLFLISESDKQYKDYEVVEWYPIYPVTRYKVLPWLYPKSYMIKSDLKYY